MEIEHNLNEQLQLLSLLYPKIAWQVSEYQFYI